MAISELVFSFWFKGHRLENKSTPEEDTSHFLYSLLLKSKPTVFGHGSPCPYPRKSSPFALAIGPHPNHGPLKALPSVCNLGIPKTKNQKPKTVFHPPTTITLVPTQLTMKLSGKATASFVRAWKPVQWPAMISSGLISFSPWMVC